MTAPSSNPARGWRWPAVCAGALFVCLVFAGDLSVHSVSPQRIESARGGVLTVAGSGFSADARLSLPGGGPHLTASWILPEGARGVEVNGGMACLTFYSHATKLGGIQILDVAGPPRQVGRFETGDSGIQVKTREGLSYVLFLNPYTFFGGVHVIDVSNPADPVRRGTFEPLADPQAIALDWPLAYVADGTAGIVIVDVSDPGAPRLVGGVDTPGSARDIAVDSGMAYVADAEGGVRVVDARDPARPILLGVNPSDHLGSGVTAGVAVLDGIVWAADSALGLVAVDLADPSSPRLIGNVPLADFPSGLVLTGDLAWVAAGSSGLQVADISDPRAPRVVGSAGLPGNSGYFVSVDLDGDRAYAADLINGLHVIDVSRPHAPPLERSVDLGVKVGDVAGDAAWVWAAAGEAGVMRVLLGADGGEETPVAVPVLDGPANALALADGLLLVAAGSAGLRSVDVADPLAPLAAGGVDTPGDAMDVAASGEHAFVADGARGLQAVDLGPPGAPALIASYDTPGSARGVIVSRDVAWVADDFSGVIAMDIVNPAAGIFKVGSVDTPGRAVDLAVSASGETLYVADMNRGVQVVDIADPSRPAIRSTLPATGSASGVMRMGDRLYVGAGFAGVQEYDLSDPLAPRLIGAYDTPGSAGRMAAAGGSVLVADGTGVRAVRPNPALPAPDGVTPDGMTVIAPAGIVPGVYDVRVESGGMEALLPNGLTVCGAGEAAASFVRSDSGWLVHVDGAAGSAAAPEALLLIPEAASAPGGIEIRRSAGREVIEVNVMEGSPAAITLWGPDPQALANRWAGIVSQGGFPLPRADAGSFGPLDLDLLPASGSGRGPGRSPARHRYELRDGVLAAARALGPGADIVVQTHAADPFGCDTASRVSFREAVDDRP